MNQRLKELIPKPWTFPYPDREMYSAEQMQYLAEQIVRECILTIQKGITRDGNTTEKYQRSMEHIRQIKDHFGVEQ